ncbi:hypothetical protein BKA82DRAFT_22829 [Pisolithus tinctorius]|uniref:Uncharacterized protein n=1 Tax=Pisolithus tinctorius Marx 270 TaxID=870435 RepID=A0A0C3P538_PISTI|nr:hypothetical protein BKA82DRAFT_22829 [Pisolithus tinctorius]KIO08215.1 hypothetical protein M404DRAFT_22829 [Pisolithus tinctorius Marx 270]
MLPYHHQYLPLNYDYTYAYDIALPPPQPEQPTTHMFTDTPQTLIPTPSDLLHHHSALDKPKHPLPSTSDLDAALVNKTETQRKARQRAVAEEIGFVPTDPDTISSHEKKRHYLECLEHYVLYLHEQLRLVHTPPLALERVSTYRGLSSRSIRTLLVHMQSVNKNLHQSILAEEQVFLDLSAEVVVAHDGNDSYRHVDPSSNYIAEPGSVVFGSEGGTYDSSSPSSSGGSGFDGMGFPFGGQLTAPVCTLSSEATRGNELPGTAGPAEERETVASLQGYTAQTPRARPFPTCNISFEAAATRPEP